MGSISRLLDTLAQTLPARRRLARHRLAVTVLAHPRKRAQIFELLPGNAAIRARHPMDYERHGLPGLSRCAAEGWQQSTNVWRKRTRPARGARLQEQEPRNPSTRVDPSMNELSSLRHLGWRDFDLARVGWKDFDLTRLDEKSHQCPVKGCSETLLGVPYRKKTLLWCPAHKIRLHSDSRTFVYWNRHPHERDARLRNFIVRPGLVSEIALKKVEAHRLGSEMSEDALSWNVFVSLAEAGKLREVIRFLTGRELRSTPQLYLWGIRIDAGAHEIYEPLCRVRANLEWDIHTYFTEPDIMLVVEQELVVCIEAKFGSENPLAHDSAPKKGEKPTSRKGLLDRYLGERTSGRTRRIVCAEQIGPTPRSQLMRNVVFASEMAEKTPWHVVNLIRGTKAPRRSKNKHASYADPTDEMRRYLHPGWRHCFTFRTWEQLHAAVIFGDPDLAHLDRYLRDKSAHFEPAFELV